MRLLLLSSLAAATRLHILVATPWKNTERRRVRADCGWCHMGAMMCYAMYAVLCCAMLCFAILCFAMLCYAVLCYAMLCYAMLWEAVSCSSMLFLLMLYNCKGMHAL